MFDHSSQKGKREMSSIFSYSGIVIVIIIIIIIIINVDPRRIKNLQVKDLTI